MSRRKRNKEMRRSGSVQSVAEVYGKLGKLPVREVIPKTTFSVDNDDVEACSRASIGRVHMASDMWYRLVALAKHFNHEWMGFLLGEVDNDEVVVTDIYFPPQTVGGADVAAVEEAKEYEVRPGTIGAIHSHVGMAAKFSSTDVTHANWPLEIVINNRAEYEATLRLKVPCGFYMRQQCHVALNGDEEIGEMIAHIEQGIRIGLRVRPSKKVAGKTVGGKFGSTVYPVHGSEKAKVWEKLVDKWEGM